MSRPAPRTGARSRSSAAGFVHDLLTSIATRALVIGAVWLLAVVVAVLLFLVVIS